MVMAREGVKIFLTDGELAKFKAVYDGLGMKQKDAGTRIIRWFVGQDDDVQKAVLEMLPKGYEVDILELMLARRRSQRAAAEDEDAAASARPKRQGKRGRNTG